jgi:hypothetical protein
MNNIHFSEKEIQQYALDKSTCRPELIHHIESCPSCMKEVKNYQLIFTEIKQIPAAAFDFDLSGLVLGQLPKPAPYLTADRFIAGFLVIFICCCVGIPFILFRLYLLNMFSGIPPFFIYAIIISVSAVLIFKILDMYKKFHRQMQLINFN